MAGWLGLRPGWLGLRPGWRGLRPGWLGLRPGWLAQRGGTDERTENLPILQDFVPYRGRCPKREKEIEKESTEFWKEISHSIRRIHRKIADYESDLQKKKNKLHALHRQLDQVPTFSPADFGPKGTHNVQGWRQRRDALTSTSDLNSAGVDASTQYDPPPIDDEAAFSLAPLSSGD